MASAAAQTEAALTPPSGIESNFNGPGEALHMWNLITQGLCISLTSIIFLLRMYVRVCVNKGFGREDCKLYLLDRTLSPLHHLFQGQGQELTHAKRVLFACLGLCIQLCLCICRGSMADLPL